MKAPVQGNTPIVAATRRQEHACSTAGNGHPRWHPGFGLCLQEVSRRVPTLAPNPSGVLLVCHKLVLPLFRQWPFLSHFSEKNSSVRLPDFSRGLKAGGVRWKSASDKTCVCQPSEQSTGKGSGTKKKTERGWLSKAPQCVHLGGRPPLCHQNWPASAGSTQGSGFNRETQLYSKIPAMARDLVVQRNLS